MKFQILQFLVFLVLWFLWFFWHIVIEGYRRFDPPPPAAHFSLPLGDSPPPPSALCQAQSQAGGEEGEGAPIMLDHICQKKPQKQ